jgi:preprotein translocase subunit SecA
VNNFVKKIKSNESNYDLDLKSKTVTLTESAISEAEHFFKIDNLYDLTNMDILHQINQSLRAHLLFTRDVDYLVNENQVIIVDEFTGRMMPGRRFSDGLHQALEAKENVKIEQEYQTHATITFQNLFRMYDKLAGMTGTAITEATEFHSIYNLDVVELPTNKPLIRKEMSDVIYGSSEEKWDAVVNEIKALSQKGQPVLVGTISIENSELLNRRLRRENIKHHVLNAKFHESEAEIVAQAGRKGAVTIATNMAGRGTDIVLGGNPDFILREELRKKGFSVENAPEIILKQIKEEVERNQKIEQNEVLAVGGLHILGTERHESRRIDNQLRGRSGRQGDPGSSRFYISLEDDLMRILGGDRVKGLLVRAGMNEGNPIENKLVTRAIENAQKQIEGQNFTMRKHLLEYDDVMNKQRQRIYSIRKDILFGKDFSQHVSDLTEDIFESIITFHFDENKGPDEWNFESFEKEIAAQYGISVKDILQEDFNDVPYLEIHDKILSAIKAAYREKEEQIGSENLREFERWIMLQIIDTQWKDHLLNIDHLKEGIGLRGYAQKDPLIEYKKESFTLFQELQDRIDDEVIRALFLFKPVAEDEIEHLRQRKSSKLTRPHAKLPGKKSGGKKKKKKKRR